MPSSAKITFAIPFYSGVEYLRRAIASVGRQTVTNWQVLVCDDRGPEDTAEAVVRSFGDPRLRYHRNQSNLGMAGNWNQCLNLAGTDLVTLLHADDELLPHYGAEMLQAAAEHSRAVAFFCEAKTIDATGRDCVSAAELFKKVLRPSQPGPLVLQGRKALEALTHGDFIMCPTVCYRRSLLRGRRFETQWRFVLDFEFFTHLLLEGQTLVGLPTRAYAYRRHDGNATSAYTANLLRFHEEIAFYNLLAQTLADRGWKLAARTARAKRSVKLHLLYCTIRDMLSFRPGDALRKLDLLVRLSGDGWPREEAECASRSTCSSSLPAWQEGVSTAKAC